jgi:diguanylate cyclase (GGDEF)-like protein
MERLRLAVAAHDWSKIDPTLRVTTSIGVAQADGETFRGLIEAADAGLYKAKQAGRNQVVLSRQS